MAELSNDNIPGSESQSYVNPADIRPVSESGRIGSLDVLRGFAVLGILVINIDMFAMPNISQQNPLVIGGTDSLNLGIWVVSQLIFLQKFMTIFSMLFGAGLILMHERFQDIGGSFQTIYLRRLRWLIVIGLVHAYLLWWGDILFAYGICGMLAFVFRRLSAKRLIVIGFVIACVTVPIMFGIGELFFHARNVSIEAQMAREAGEELTSEQVRFETIWQEISKGYEPTQEELQKNIDEYRGSLPSIFIVRAKESIMAQVVIFPFYSLWRALGMMLIGMGLMKLRFFSGEWSLRSYGIALAIGYIFGFALSGSGTYSILTSGYDPLITFRVMGVNDYIGSIFIALGHASLVLIVHKLSLFNWLLRRLGAVGRMALSNYLFHSIVFTTVFYGYGLSFYGQLDRVTLILMAIAMWIFQLYISPIWFRHYRFGPAEWVWRYLTYRQRPPMRVGAAD